jgi:hypothetical protein
LKPAATSKFDADFCKLLLLLLLLLLIGDNGGGDCAVVGDVVDVNGARPIVETRLDALRPMITDPPVEPFCKQKLFFFMSAFVFNSDRNNNNNKI